MVKEKEFFIRKAIVWCIREISKADPDGAFNFPMKIKDKASGLTIREGSKRLPEKKKALILRNSYNTSCDNEMKQTCLKEAQRAMKITPPPSPSLKGRGRGGGRKRDFQMKNYVSILFLFVLLLSSCSIEIVETSEVSSDDYKEIKQYLSKYILKQMRKYDVPGVSIALVADQELIWAEGFGYADKENEIPATAETVYEIGSITKPFTATAAMKLVEQGKLGLDHPLESYLPTFSMKRIVVNAVPITPRALLSHHAGLPRYYLKGMISNQPKSLLEESLNEDYVLYVPGTRFEYSNVGFALMWDVIQRLSGESYASFIENELFMPLQMHHTAFYLNDKISPLLAKGYAHGKPMPLLPWRDGELLSNVLDLSRFMKFIFADGIVEDQRILGKKAIDQMFESQFPQARLDFGIRYGLGWFLTDSENLQHSQLAWHYGRTLSFWGKILLLRNEKLGIVVLCNSNTGRHLVNAVAQEAMELLLEADEENYVEEEDISEEDVISGSEDEKKTSESYTGCYSYSGHLIQIFQKGNNLKLKTDNQTFDLIPLGGNAFRVVKRLFGFIPLVTEFQSIKFVRDDENIYIVTYNKGIRSGEKIEPYAIPNAWKIRLGEYRLINPDHESVIQFKHIRLTVEDEILFLEIESDQKDAQGKLILKPISENVAYILGAKAVSGLNGAIVCQHVGDKEQFRFSGYMFERI